MALYEYKCATCEDRFDLMRPMSDADEPAECPECGSTVFYTLGSRPDVVAIPVGAFADTEFPPPTVSVYESRRHSWARMPDSITQESA